ncbi:MAG: Nif3-like dinuclear metal center hexameric protein [Bacteroidales bacterium]|nr:Nif3-like dinuclear metal center hexameric protein [Bacteroidales bacterium]
MLAKEIVRPIEQFAPLALQESWDNCGFSVGDPEREVKGALIALDCTEEVLDEAIELGCDMIITHHPLIFKGLKSITPANATGRIVSKAIRHNIAIYAAHTNMDKAADGVSGLMANKLELSNRETLSADGLGIIGDLREPVDAMELVGIVKERFGADNLRSSALLEKKISRVAVCGGSGRSFIPDAMSKGAQVYITGDITYHEFYCEKGFMVMDIGHYLSEYDVVGLFAKIVCENFPNFAVSISRKNNNPIYYY